MRLVFNWRRVLKRSWSVRFQLIQATGVGLLTGVYGYTMGWPLWLGSLFCVGCVAFSCMGIVARIIWQPQLHGGDDADQ